MAIKPDYQVGTITVAANGTTVTGVGTLWVAADIQPGDMFGAQGYPLTRIVSINSNTSLTIEPWRGVALSAGSAYFVRYQPDGSRFTAALRDLVTSIAGGSLAALQSITGAANKLAYFTSSSAMALTDLTAVGRAIIGAATADAQLTALGVSTWAKTLLDDADAGAARTTIGAQPLSTNLNSLQAATGSNILAYRRGNIMDAVAQTGGNPTGGLFEKGSNGNGEYVRYADGTQICWGTVASAAATTASGTLFTSGSNGWTFPIAFASAPNVTASASISASFANAVGATTTAVSLIRFCTVTDAVTTRTISAIAVGRWF